MSDVLRERIATVLMDEGGGPGNSLHSCRCAYPEIYGPCDCLREVADAVIAALGLVESKAVYAMDDTPAPFRRYVTPWERIEEDG